MHHSVSKNGWIECSLQFDFQKPCVCVSVRVCAHAQWAQIQENVWDATRQGTNDSIDSCLCQSGDMNAYSFPFTSNGFTQTMSHCASRDPW